jgi:hypothetical protein
MFRWYFEFRQNMEVRQLNCDASLIVRHATELFKPTVLNEIAVLVRNHIERAHVQYGTNLIDLKRAHFDYKRLHKEAQRRADQTGLSSMTLIIIYLRAEIAGPKAGPARQGIEAFVKEYAATNVYKKGTKN